MDTPWALGDYVVRLIGVLVFGCIAFSPRSTLRFIFGRSADAASDERIGMLRGIAIVVGAGTAIEVIMHTLR
jgi:hypothetical protein